MIRNFTILILFCLLTAAACGAGSGERSAKKLVSPADAEKIMGVPMKLAQEQRDEKQNICYYSDTDGIWRLQVTIQEYESEEQTKEAHEFMQDINRHYVKVQPVEGVGDGAWLENREFSQAIHVRRKNVAFLIVADGEDNSGQRLAELRRVAARVAERL